MLPKYPLNAAVVDVRTNVSLPDIIERCPEAGERRRDARLELTRENAWFSWMHAPTDPGVRQIVPRLLGVKEGAVVAQPLREHHVSKRRRTLCAAGEFWQLCDFSDIELLHARSN